MINKISQKYIFPVVKATKEFKYSEKIPLDPIECIFLVLLITTEQEKAENVLNLIKKATNLSNSYDDYIIGTLNKLRKDDNIKSTSESITQDTLRGDILINPKITECIKEKNFFKIQDKKKKEDFSIIYNPIYDQYIEIDNKNSELLNKIDLTIDQFWNFVKQKETNEEKINEKLNSQIEGSSKYNNQNLFVYEIDDNIKELEPLYYESDSNLEIQISNDENDNFKMKLPSQNAEKLFKFFIDNSNNQFNIAYLLSQIFSPKEEVYLNVQEGLDVLGLYKDEPAKNIEIALKHLNIISSELYILDENLSIIDDKFQILGKTNRNINILDKAFDFDFIGKRDLKEDEIKRLFIKIVNNDTLEIEDTKLKLVLSKFILENKDLFNQYFLNSLNTLFKLKVLNNKQISKEIDKEKFIQLINNEYHLLARSVFKEIFFEIVSINNKQLLQKVNFAQLEDKYYSIFETFIRKNHNHILEMEEIEHLKDTKYYENILRTKESLESLLQENQIFEDKSISELENIYTEIEKIKNNDKTLISKIKWNKEIEENFNQIQKLLQDAYVRETNQITISLRQILEKEVDLRFEYKKEKKKNPIFNEKIKNEKLKKEFIEDYELKKFNPDNFSQWWKYLSKLVHSANTNSFESNRKKYHFLIKNFSDLIKDKNENNLKKIIKIFNDLKPGDN